MVAWPSFHNDVLVPQADTLDYEIKYGTSFELCWVCILMGIIIAMCLEMLTLRNRGQGKLNKTTKNMESTDEDLPSGWEKILGDDGYYYFNAATSQTSYDPPPRTTVAQ